MKTPDTRKSANASGGQLLFLTDERLRESVELLFFAYRDYTSDSDRILAARGLGRAHHRALYFVGRQPGITVAELLEVLDVKKQSLARVLKPLIADGLIEQGVGENDRRQRPMRLSAAGEALERDLFKAQSARMRTAFSEAEYEAVRGFRKVLEQMVDAKHRAQIMALLDRG